MCFPGMKSKKGSVSVFLVFILAAMVGLTAAFIYASKQKAYTGICDGAINLAMRSVLSEFDLTLYERYGLMAFEKSGMEAALEVNDYVDYSFEGRAPVKKTQTTFGDYSLADVSNLKEQIREHMQSDGALHLLSDGNEDTERQEWKDRVLRNQGLIHSLPSGPFKDGGVGFMDRIEAFKDSIKSADSILSEVSGTYLVDRYILNHFKYATGGPLNEESFFQHEVEYILVGEYSNADNREKVEKALTVFRTALNTAFLYSDEKRCAQTLAAAEVLTPATAPATQAVIIATWAAAEAKNDVKLLIKGRPVPLMKTEKSWATSLDNVLNNISEGIIDTGTDKGLGYSDYMMIFLHFQNEEVKLARVADLIQINMKGTQDRGFLMKTCNEGMFVTTEIYGKVHTYETCY